MSKLSIYGQKRLLAALLALCLAPVCTHASSHFTSAEEFSMHHYALSAIEAADNLKASSLSMTQTSLLTKPPTSEFSATTITSNSATELLSNWSITTFALSSMPHTAMEPPILTTPQASIELSTTGKVLYYGSLFGLIYCAMFLSYFFKRPTS